MTALFNTRTATIGFFACAFAMLVTFVVAIATGEANIVLMSAPYVASYLFIAQRSLGKDGFMYAITCLMLAPGYLVATIGAIHLGTTTIPLW